MHHKFISKFKLHSIPIKTLRYVSYSIPLMCMLALLLLIGNIFCVFSKSSEVFADSGNDEIEAYATTVNPTASIQIANSSLESTVSPGSTSYVSSNVDVSASDIADYVLTIAGPTGLTGATAITGADGKIGTELTDNTWGYAWADTGADDETLIYNSLSGEGAAIARGKATSLDMSKKLTFAAKFGSEAKSGHYTANVTLSLTATPKEVAEGFGSINTMQEMTPEVCKAVEIGATGSLEDTRDGSVYKVSKLNDGRCWMTQNLRLDLTEAGIATAAGSDNLAADFPAEAITSAEKFTNNNDAAQFSKGPTIINESYPGDGKGYQPEYGYYYSWCAATGGTCEGVSTDGDNASGSICPKGWRLPKSGSGTTNDFAIMGGITSNVTKDTNYWGSAKNISFSGNTLTVNGSTWIAAGDVNTGGLVNPGSDGRYWSSTASSSTDAYYLYFYGGNFDPAGTLGKYLGRTVRCVAEEPEELKVTIQTISTMQEMTPEICENTAIGATATLTDSRDNSTYTVGKLSDGKCWMTQNLRITRETINAKDGNNTTGKITSADSHVSANYEIPASTTGAFSNAQSGSYYTNQQVRASVDNDYGAYYSYNVATANTVATISSGSATYDICPKGWRLPTGGSSGEFQALYNKWTSATWTTNNGKNGRWLGGASAAAGGSFFPAAGNVYTSGLGSTGSYGYYWSSTIYSATYAYDLYFYSSSDIYPADRNIRCFGYSVRCVAC